MSSGHGIHPPRRGPFYMGPSQHLRQDTVTRIEGLTAQSRTFKDAQIEDWTIRKADQRISLPLMSTTTHRRRDNTWFRPLQSLTRQLSGLPSPYTFSILDSKLWRARLSAPSSPHDKIRSTTSSDPSRSLEARYTPPSVPLDRGVQMIYVPMMRSCSCTLGG